MPIESSIRPSPAKANMHTAFGKAQNSSFRTGPSLIDGVGLFAVCELPARRKLGELTGEVITVAEGDRRAKLLMRIAIVELPSGITIDATHSECIFKYVNHSCEPNSYIRCTATRVEFYTLRKISTGEEITTNYGLTQHAGRLRCRCKSKRCSEYL